MDEDEKRRVLAEARANVADIDQHRAEFERRRAERDLVAEEDPIERWARGMPQPEAEKPRKPPDALVARMAAELRNELGEMRRFICNVIAETIAMERDDLLAEIEKQVGELRAEMNVLRSVDHDKVVDLPDAFRHRRGGAA
jgi:hypothetical protein